MSKKKKIKTKGLFNVPIEEFEEFELKEQNWVKINLTESGGLNGEGIWAWLSDADLVKHNADNKDGYGIAVAANQSLSGIPWKGYFPFKFNGENRPTCNMSAYVNLDAEPIYHSTYAADKKKAEEEEAKEAKAEAKKEKSCSAT